MKKLSIFVVLVAVLFLSSCYEEKNNYEEKDSNQKIEQNDEIVIDKYNKELIEEIIEPLLDIK
ncbi:MAG: hypothetical protein Q9M94_07765 [Candidatus Gracilibacteria bacterium]|nr:hypothetical protein [Candidatus Gracilibacteria bacterium]MDQ7022211.1 hypothetical protein [Candidatus Gracilibacteria bacterium]